MNNHYHFVVQTHQGNLSRLMRHVNGVYTQTYNRRHRKVGHRFQGRFKAILVEEEKKNYLLEVCRYVDLNPVRASLVTRPDAWAWSSYRAHTGRVAPPAWLDSAALYRRLAPRAPRREGPARYAAFVAQGRGVKLWEERLSGQIYLGSEAFVKRLQADAESLDAKEIPRAQRRAKPRPVPAYFKGAERDAGIVATYREGGHTQSAIANACALSVSPVSRLIAAYEAKGKTLGLLSKSLVPEDYKGQARQTTDDAVRDSQKSYPCLVYARASAQPVWKPTKREGGGRSLWLTALDERWA